MDNDTYSRLLVALQELKSKYRSQYPKNINVTNHKNLERFMSGKIEAIEEAIQVILELNSNK